MRNSIIYKKNVILFLFAISLFVGCQKDDTNADVESEQLKKELSRAELEKRVVEMYNSQECRDFEINNIKIFEARKRLGKRADEKLYEKRYRYLYKMIEKYPSIFTDSTTSVLSEMLESGRLEMKEIEGYNGDLYKYILVPEKKK